jgi:hypothetical protein
VPEAEAAPDSAPVHEPAARFASPGRELLMIAHWRQAGHKEQTVAALAGLVCGEKVLERLSRDQVHRVAWLLELAVVGRVSRATLAAAIASASRR